MCLAKTKPEGRANVVFRAPGILANIDIIR